MKVLFINPTELAYAAEEVCGKPHHLRPLVMQGRNDGRPTKPQEIARMWAAYLKKR